MTTLRTQRLVLRPLRRDDLEHLQRYGVRPEFYRYLYIPRQTPEIVAAYLKQQLAEDARHDKQRWVFAVEPHEVAHLVGTVRMTILSREQQAADIGYFMDSDYYGRGYATEAARALLDFGFRELKLHRISATADVENQASWRVLERIGMKREGLLRKDKFIRGEWRDFYLYAILEEDFL